MPRTQFRAEVLSTPNATATVAAATRLTRRAKEDRKPRNATGWQRRAWLWYDTIGEYRFACSWVGNVLSRASLYVTKDGTATDEDDAKGAMDSLFGGHDGQVEMLRQIGIQMSVAGECYLVGEDGGESPTDKWFVVAATNINRIGDGQWSVGKTEIDNALVIRLWKPHPYDFRDSDSPSRAVLPILAEIDGLTKHVAAQIDSRLAGAGLLLLPQEITFGTVGTEQNEDGEIKHNVTSSLDTFLQELMDTMMTAVSNREDASALVPILLQASGEHLDKVRHVTFSTPLDEQSIALRAEAIRRLALGMDMPPEVLTGTGEMNHWNAWQMEEAAIKAHTEPLLEIITTSLTTAYLRPYLESFMSEEEARRYSIKADTAKLRLRPNRSKEAIELYDRGALSRNAMVRENGFDDEDIMDDKERTTFFTEKTAGGSTTPELVAEALRLLGVPVNVSAAETIEVQEARPTRSLLDHPENNPPDESIIVSDEAAAVAEVVVFRALERAGNRIKSKYKDRISMGAENVPPHTLYRFTRSLNDAEIGDVLFDSWSCLGSLPKIPVTPQTLDEYARNLIATNSPHDSRRFRTFLEERAS